MRHLLPILAASREFRARYDTAVTPADTYLGFRHQIAQFPEAAEVAIDSAMPQRPRVQR